MATLTLFCLLIGFFSSVGSSSNVRSFSISSESQIVEAGTDVILTCQFPSSTTVACGSLYWYRGPTMLSQCKRITTKDNHISVRYNNANFSQLSIQRVNPTDSGVYSCGLLRNEDTYEASGYYPISQSQDYEEGSATLTVLNVTETPPVCKSVHADHVGQTVSMTCSPPEDSYNALLIWYAEDSEILQGPQLTNDVLTFTATLQEDDNFKEFFCLVSNGEETVDLTWPSCSLTPLRLHFIVAVAPPNARVHQGQPANFTCVTQSVSAIERYRWYVLLRGRIRAVDPDCSSCRYKILDRGRMLQIPEVTAAEDNGLRVKCTASNTQREQQTEHSQWGLLSVTEEKLVDENITATNHSHAVPTFIGILVSVCISVAAAVLMYRILRKRLTRRVDIPQPNDADRQRYQNFEMKPLSTQGEPPASTRRVVDQTEMPYEVPTSLPANTGGVPPELPAKECSYELVNLHVQHLGMRANQGPVDAEEAVYDTPRPQQVCPSTKL